MERTLAGDTVEKVGEKVVLKGWVQARRDHGKLVFVDLRDRSGIVQVVGGEELGGVGIEDVVEVEGEVKRRPENLVNPNLKTGIVEVKVDKLTIISKTRELPFPIDTDGYEIEETTRNKYRYVDLRRPRMTMNLRVRSQVAQFMRRFLTERDFVEIETPILTKTTPEGARDFLVPSRLQPGKFYALPQSPQQYKQLLMVAGLERYFQLARCFRDEDPRADRAYGEFTQLDLEMSFVTQEDILQLTEELFTQLVKEVWPEKRISQSPWPRLAHKEAIEKYGTDKPDLRKDKADKDELAFAWTIDFPLFTKQTQEDFYYGSGRAQFAPSHHMFTSPHPDDIPLLDSDPLKVRGLQHDLVLNGFEIGGGSVRIHQPEIQEKVFELIGFSDQQKKQFSHMLTAFGFGVPPHGGIAPGVDRFVYVALGEPNIREVMAFPTSASGQTAVMDAPSEATEEQLKELGVAVIGKRLNPKGLKVYEQIVKLLEKNKCAFKTYEHEPVFTSEQAASVRGTKLEQGAKALVMIADKKPVMLVLSAATKVDLKAFKKVYAVKDLRMAKPEEVEEITGLKIGAIPPLGNLFDLPTYVDAKLGENQKISFNAGLHEKSLEMYYTDFARLVEPIVGKFTA